MSCDHFVSLSVNTAHYVAKDLLVGIHPESIHNEKQGRKRHHSQSVFGEAVIHRRWHFISVCQSVSLSAVKDEVAKSCDWEQNRKASSVHHGDIQYV